MKVEPDAAVRNGDSIFQVGHDLSVQVLTRSKELRGSHDDVLFQGIMSSLFCKGFKSHQAAGLLWNGGFQHDAFVLARTLFELVLQGRYLALEPALHSRLYAEHDPLVRYQLHLGMVEIGEVQVSRLSAERKEELKEMEALYRTRGQRHPRGKGWWGESIQWLAKVLGTETYRRYMTVYWMQSNLVHSNSPSLNSYMEEHGDGLKLNCNPEPSNDLMIPQEATLCLIELARMASEALDLKMETEIQAAYTGFKAVAGEGSSGAGAEGGGGARS